MNDAERKAWALWFEAQDIESTGPARGPSFNDSGLLLKAVLAGQGAALLPAAVVADDLAQGRLVQLSDVSWLEDFAYYLVYPENSHDRPKVAAFREWILGEASKRAISSRKSAGSAGRGGKGRSRPAPIMAP